jgi:polyisoprenyl-phosphate glycosyltransferase
VLPELFARLEALFRANGDCAWRAVFVERRQPRPLGGAHPRPGPRDPRFELVELSRNFGFQSALAAGLAHAAGADAVVTMDADLQDPRS